MDKKMKIFTGLAILFFAGALVWAFSASPEAPESADSGEPKVESLSYSGNTIVEEKNGRKVWELKADAIEIDPKTNNTVLKTVQGFFYQENGEVVELNSPAGIYDTKQQKISFMQGVDAKMTDGSSFRADSASWDADKKLFHAEGSVRVEKDDAVLTGDVLDSTANFSTVRMTGNAHVIKGGK